MTKLFGPMMALMLSTGAVLMMAPTAVAGTSCSDGSYGVGWEYPSCNFSCTSGESVAVAVSQQDNDYVDGTASCRGARATCALDTGACAMRGTNTATSSGAGDCDGSAYSGGTTDAHIYCAGGDGQAATMLVSFLSGKAAYLLNGVNTANSAALPTASPVSIALAPVALTPALEPVCSLGLFLICQPTAAAAAMPAPTLELPALADASASSDAVEPTFCQLMAEQEARGNLDRMTSVVDLHIGGSSFAWAAGIGCYEIVPTCTTDGALTKCHA